MLLSELSAAVKTATDDATTQQVFVDSLVAKIQGGETSIKVFANDIWTTVNLQDFWQLQYNKLLKMLTYAGQLNGLGTTLQETLDSQIPTIPLPDSEPTVVTTDASKVPETDTSATKATS